jgi:hypothetical protein
MKNENCQILSGKSSDLSKKRALE